MKNDSQLQTIVDTARKWVNEVPDDARAIVILAYNKCDEDYKTFYHAGWRVVRNMLYNKFSTDPDFLRAAQRAMEWVEYDKYPGSGPATPV